jgi:hypothetical protein
MVAMGAIFLVVSPTRRQHSIPYTCDYHGAHRSRPFSGPLGVESATSGNRDESGMEGGKASRAHFPDPDLRQAESASFGNLTAWCDSQRVARDTTEPVSGGLKNPTWNPTFRS